MKHANSKQAPRMPVRDMAQHYGSWAVRRLIPLIAALALTWAALRSLNSSKSGPPTITPLSFGAVADGQTLDTSAIQNAIDACSASSGCSHVILRCPAGAIWVRSHMTFEVGVGVTLKGVTDPDAYPFIYARFEGTMRFGHAGLVNAGRCLWMSWFADTSSLLYPGYPGDGDMCWRWDAVQNVTITGDGIIDGQGDWWWKRCFETKDATCPDGSNQRQRPSLLKLIHVDRLRITRLTLRDSPFWFIHPIFCNDVIVEHVAAVAPPDSRNTDGLDPDSCNDVYVNNCVFETGDDCIAIKSGRGPGGIAIGRPTRNVLVENCEFRYGHGVTIGSEMSGGIYNITFRNSKIIRTKVGFRLKTTRGRGGAIDGVVFESFQVIGTPLLLSLDMDYEKTKSKRNIPVVRNIVIQDIAGSNVGQMGKANCLPESPCTGIILKNISVTGQTRPFSCVNVFGTEADVTPHAGCVVPN